MSITTSSFGKLPSGQETTLYTITNASGASVSITNYGGIISKILVPNKQGQLIDVVLGGANVSAAPKGSGYLGALIGRSGNRFCDGKARLNGEVLQLARNANGHHLHGGYVGFDQKVWETTPDELTNSLRMTITSPDGEENYPGTLEVIVTYTWSEQNALSIHYEAVSDKDTLCNLTNHAYFNLEGEESDSISDHEILIAADKLTVVDKDCIPTGELRDVTGTPFDLRKFLRIGDGLAHQQEDEQMRFGGGYDHNFALNGEGTREVAKVYSSKTGIEMSVTTDQLGVQLYTGNMLDGSYMGKSGKTYMPRAGLCLETQFFPDSPNHDEFVPCVLRAGDKYDTTTTYAFLVR